jgi:hypothetical protein
MEVEDLRVAVAEEEAALVVAVVPEEVVVAADADVNSNHSVKKQLVTS